MTPAKLLNNQIPIDHDLSNMNGMITADFIVLNPFILALIAIREQLIPLLICHLHSNALCHWLVPILLER